MNWVTVIWSVGGGACLTLAFIQFIVWCKNRSARANLAFSALAVAVAALAALELALMRAETPEQFGTVARWMHVPAWVIVASLVAFVRLYLRAGRRWLAWAVIGVRTLSLILNFVFSPNINYWQITPLRHISFLGESVAIPTGVPNPWMLIAQFSLLLLVIFVIDATITVWRRGDRRQGLVVGGSIVFFAAVASAQATAVTWELISMPLTVSLFFQGLVAVMAYELSYDVLRAATLARRLQTSEAELREEHGEWIWRPARRDSGSGYGTSCVMRSGFPNRGGPSLVLRHRTSSIVVASETRFTLMIENRSARLFKTLLVLVRNTKPSTGYYCQMVKCAGWPSMGASSSVTKANQPGCMVFRAM
jgi:hypothetical protein